MRVQIANSTKRFFKTNNLFTSLRSYSVLPPFERIERFPGQIKEEQRRRKRFLDLLPDNSVTIIEGAKTLYMTNDIPYPFRQDTNLFYLTGFEEPEAALLIDKRDSNKPKFLMFVLPKDPHRELWDGKRVGPGGCHLYGADESYSNNEIQYFILDILKTAPSSLLLNENAKNKYLPLIREKKSNIEVNPVESKIESLRKIKTEVDQYLAKTSAEISNQGFRAMMKFCPTVKNPNEYLIESVLEHNCKMLGAQRLAYPPVVAGGGRANTLHYITNNLPVMDGELVLVDGGSEFHCFSSDVTRTFPVNGKFSDAQKEIYQAVLDAQKFCIELSVVGNSLDKIHYASVMFLAERLAQLFNVAKQNYHKYYPHSIGHYLGMDVHDTPSVSTKEDLVEGMYITIEPGLYIPDSVNIPPQYRNIGIRIEDNILITKDGPVVITKDIPKEIEEVEYVMNSGR